MPELLYYLYVNFVERLIGSAAALRLCSICLGLLLLPATAAEHGIALPKLRSGRATLQQQGRLTILEIKSRSGTRQRIALTHPSDYRQTANAPLDAELIAENPGHFLIFTDTLSSNPGNPQGRCGADGEERFVHVVALGPLPHETLSVLMDSCLWGVEASSRSPEWIAKADSAGFIGHIALSFEEGPPVSYYVAPDGDVTRPQVEKPQ